MIKGSNQSRKRMNGVQVTEEKKEFKINLTVLKVLTV